MIATAEVPPSPAAAHCSAVASVPKSDGYLCQVRWDRLPIGSPARCSCEGVITYGSWPSSAIRPYVA